jgi:hypothetical protein
VQLPVTQTISSSATDKKNYFLEGINASYFGSVRIYMPKIALEISELALPASDWLPRLDDSLHMHVGKPPGLWENYSS